MGNNRKMLEFDCVNRIKYEERGGFEDSLFANVYDKAARLVVQIVEENIQAADENGIADGFCTEERFNNNISFWGKRGMGKSSAMLSFALFLKKYNHRVRDRFYLNTSRQPEFYVLPRIDAAMLVKGEYLLDIILAKMWNAFEEKDNSGVIRNIKASETRQYFENVKKSYEAYRRAISGKDDKYEMTSVRQLKELSKCLNLKEDFKRLVDSFLSCMSEHRGEISFLVLVIDDLDVVVDDVNNILEQVRLFLSVPKAIVLVTADYDRLFLECNKSLSDQLICRDNIVYYERNQIRDFVEKYLAKIFPNNMRVHMPRLNTAGGVDYNVKLPEGSTLLNERQEVFDGKRLLFIMLAKYTKIMMYPFKRGRHFLQKTSLRGIVNELYELEKMNSMDEQERFETACNWILAALTEDGKTIMEAWEYNWAQIVMEGNSVNEVIVTILAGREEEAQRQKSQDETRLGYGQGLRQQGEEAWRGYGQMLKLIDKLVEFTGQDFRKFGYFALIFYSVQAAEFLRSSSEGKEFADLYGRDFFYPSVEAAAQKKGNREEKTNLDSMPCNRLQLKFPVPVESVPGDSMENASVNSGNEIRQILSANLHAIYKVFKLANLCEWNLWDENEEERPYIQYKAAAEQEEEMGKFVVQPTGQIAYDTMNSQGSVTSEAAGTVIGLSVQTDNSKVSIEILLWNSLSYEEHLRGFCRNLYKALCTLKKSEISEEQMCMDIDKILSDPVFRIEEYRKWRESVKGIDSLVPWQSAEVMLYLANEIGKVQQLVGEKDLFERILTVQRRQMGRLIQKLERIEEYYRPLFDERKTYTQTLKDYIQIMEPYSFDGIVTYEPDDKTIDTRTAM